MLVTPHADSSDQPYLNTTKQFLQHRQSGAKSLPHGVDECWYFVGTNRPKGEVELLLDLLWSLFVLLALLGNIYVETTYLLVVQAKC